MNDDEYMNDDEFKIQKSVKVKPFEVDLETLKKINTWGGKKIELLVPLPIIQNLYVLSIIATLSVILLNLLKNKCDVEITFLLLTEQTNHSKYINNSVIKHIESITSHENSFAMTENIRTAEFKSLMNLILLSLVKIENEGEGNKNIMKEIISSKVTYIDIDAFNKDKKIPENVGEIDAKYKIDEYLKIFIQRSFLFIWDKIPGDDEERFKNFLTQKLKQKLDVSWIEGATIKKINKNTIKLYSSTRKDLLMLSLEHDNNVKLTGDTQIDDFMEWERNGKLEIYGNGYSNCYYNQLSSVVKHFENSSDKKILCINNNLIDLFDVASNNFVLLGYPSPINQKALVNMGDTIPAFVTPTSKFINNASSFALCIDEFHFSGLFIELNSKLFESNLDVRSEYIRYLKSKKKKFKESEVFELYFKFRDETLELVINLESDYRDEGLENYKKITKSQEKILELINDGFLTVQNETMAELKFLL